MRELSLSFIGGKRVSTPADLAIRPAILQDAAAIARVHVDSWRTTYRDIVPDEILAKLSYEERERLWSRVVTDPKQFTFVAEAPARIVGFANGGRNRGSEAEYSGELYAVYLVQAHQQRGVGLRLTVAVARELERAGMRSMIVWVLRDNPACAFYRKLGGQQVASKLIVMGDRSLEEVAFGWTEIRDLIRPR